MYIFITCVIIALIFIFLANRHQSKLKKEKAEGKWDFILNEFIPYLKSHSEPVKITQELSFMSYNGAGTTKFNGKIHYNSAGILIEKIVDSKKVKVIEFFRGKDEPSKFKPLFEGSLYGIRRKDDDIILDVKTSAIDCKELIIDKAPDYLFEELKGVFE